MEDYEKTKYSENQPGDLYWIKFKGVQSFKEKDYAYLFVHIVLISPYYQETNWETS